MVTFKTECHLSLALPVSPSSSHLSLPPPPPPAHPPSRLLSSSCSERLLAPKLRLLALRSLAACGLHVFLPVPSKRRPGKYTAGPYVRRPLHLRSTSSWRRRRPGRRVAYPTSPSTPTPTPAAPAPRRRLKLEAKRTQGWRSSGSSATDESRSSRVQLKHTVGPGIQTGTTLIFNDKIVHSNFILHILISFQQ